MGIRGIKPSARQAAFLAKRSPVTELGRETCHCRLVQGRELDRDATGGRYQAYRRYAYCFLLFVFLRLINGVEDGMLLPPLCTQSEYVRLAEEAGLQIFSEPLDISLNVAKTWYATTSFARLLLEL